MPCKWGKGEKATHGSGQAAVCDPPKTVTTTHATDALRSKHKMSHGGSAADTHSSQFHFLEQRGFFLTSFPTSSFCNFWTNQSAATAFFFFLHDARFYFFFFKGSRSISEACTSVHTRKDMQGEKIYTLSPGCRYCLASGAIIKKVDVLSVCLSSDHRFRVALFTSGCRCSASLWRAHTYTQC